jgi:hypothetical protein
MNSPSQSTLIGLFAALIGYELRAYWDRTIAFFEITFITDVGTRSDPDELPNTVAEKLTRSFYIGSLSNGSGHSVHTTNGELFDRWNRSDDLVRFWPSLKGALEQLVG